MNNAMSVPPPPLWKCGALLLGVLLQGACTSRPVYLNRDIFTVAVLRPMSEDVDARVEERLWPHVEQAVAQKGFRLVDHFAVASFYARNKFHLGGEIRQYSHQELCAEFKCDGLVYSAVTRCGEQTLVVYKKVAVGLEAELIDGRDQSSVWFGEGEASHTETAGSWSDAAVMAAKSVLDRLIETGEIDHLAGEACRATFRSLPFAGFGPTPE